MFVDLLKGVALDSIPALEMLCNSTKLCWGPHAVLQSNFALACRAWRLFCERQDLLAALTRVLCEPKSTSFAIVEWSVVLRECTAR